MPATTLLSDAEQRRLRGHWVVRMNHRNRTWGFAMLGLVMGLHIAPNSPSWLSWSLLGSTFLLYPQVAWWVAMRSIRPLWQELWHMRLDALLFGAWTAALHFPVWITFALFISPTLNLALFRGLRGLLEAVAFWVTGALATGTVVGWKMQPETDTSVTWVTMIVLNLYLLVTGLDNHQRSMKLHEARKRLRHNEQDLQRQLLEIHQLQDKLKEQALRDPLTGLYNRHLLDETLNREINRCNRARQPLTLLLIDVDHFKGINDRWGHQMGDNVLRQVASRLQSEIRSSDWCFRYGGEEFLLVFPEMDVEQAWEKAEKLRQWFAANPLEIGDASVKVTVSGGIAALTAYDHDVITLIQRADLALYSAKHQGRNRMLVGSLSHASSFTPLVHPN